MSIYAAVASSPNRGSRWRNISTGAAAVIALGIFGAGLIWIVPTPGPPITTPAETVTDTTKTTSDGQKTVIEKTHVTSTSPPSIWERYLAEGRVELLVRLGIVSLAAFLAAAFVQKVMLGQYAITLPFVTIPGISDAAASSAQGLEELQKTVSKQSDDLQLALNQAAVALDGSAQALRQVKDVRRRLRSKVKVDG